uniref:Uncharacterized protein n=1 Tax=Oryza barthii TaxID=65489 RepID=A0A0D3H527_9ORYZ
MRLDVAGRRPDVARCGRASASHPRVSAWRDPVAEEGRDPVTTAATSSGSSHRTSGRCSHLVKSIGKPRPGRNVGEIGDAKSGLSNTGSGSSKG